MPSSVAANHTDDASVELLTVPENCTARTAVKESDPSPQDSGSLFSSQVANTEMLTLMNNEPAVATISSRVPHGDRSGFRAASATADSAKPAVITFDNTKAGLQSVDKTKTEAIIAEMSEGSNYYLNEERKLKNRQKKVVALEEKKRKYDHWKRSSPIASAKMRQSVDALESSMESERYTHRIFAHLDMDMFYAAVEEKKNPELKKCPLGVGSMSMLSTTNYVARQYGVRAGMAGFIGKKLCPELILVPLDFKQYKLEAQAVRAVTARYDPHFSALGWDELTMELTLYVHVHFPEAESMEEKYKAAEKAMEECRQQIFESTGLTASVGIGPTTSLAKMASNYNKPNGQFCLALTSGDAIRAYLWEKSVRSIQGIGKSTEFLLNGIGITTLGEVYDSRYLLCYLLTPKTFAFLFSSSIGSVRHCFSDYDRCSDSAEANAENCKEEEHEEQEGQEPPQKSVGEESTFSPLANKAALEEIAHHHLCRAYNFVQKHSLVVGQMVLKVKYRSFRLQYFSHSIDPPTNSEKVLQRVLDKLLVPLLPQFDSLRLLGVRLEKLDNRPAGEGESAPSGVPRTLSDFFKKRCRDHTLENARSLTHGAQERQERKRMAPRRRLESAHNLDDDDDDVVCLSSREGSVCSEKESARGEGESPGCYVVASPPSKAAARVDRSPSLVLISSSSSSFHSNSVSTASLCSMSPARSACDDDDKDDLEGNSSSYIALNDENVPKERIETARQKNEGEAKGTQRNFFGMPLTFKQDGHEIARQACVSASSTDTIRVEAVHMVVTESFAASASSSVEEVVGSEAPVSVDETSAASTAWAQKKHAISQPGVVVVEDMESEGV